MFCNNCHSDLAAFDSVLDKMKNCPICGKELKKEVEIPKQKSFADLCKLLKEKSSAEIFGSADLLSSLVSLDLSYQNARDRMSILCIRDIPGRIHRVAQAPKGEKEYELGSCQKMLVDDLGISIENSTNMLNCLQNVLFEKPVSIPANYNDSTFTDPRDGHVYKTVRIGNQIWMAENLCYAMDGAYAYDNAYNQIGIYGYLYSKEALKKAAPSGWHVPSKQEFEELLRNASMVKGNSATKVLTSKDNNGLDLLGFNALYAGYYRHDGCFNPFSLKNECACFSCGNGEYLEISKVSTCFQSVHSSDSCCSVRLIKDKV